jgi:L-seryl-tRNA(Ser) seleniumtransferase
MASTATAREYPVLEAMGLRPVINAAGTPSRLGCGRYPEPVQRAMREATQCFVPITELQGRANAAIRELTGAEAGCATTGAAGALFLGTCAALAGSDLAAMDALPALGDRPFEVVVHRTHRNPYDHAVRAAGARLVEFGYSWEGVGAYRWQLEAAITSRTAAVLYSANAEWEGLPLADVCRIAHAADVPVLVDAAEALPPVSRVRDLIAAGADLVAISGGKGLRGPAASGVLAGRRDLVQSAALQQQDMYTTPELFTGPFGEPEPPVPEPGHHGVGRPLKLGREQIAGLIAAIDAFLARDHRAVAERGVEALEQIRREIAEPPGVDVALRRSAPDADPELLIRFEGESPGDRALAVARRLLADEPRIFVDDGRLRHGVIRISAASLDASEIRVVGVRLAATLADAAPPE